MTELSDLTAVQIEALIMWVEPYDDEARLRRLNETIAHADILRLRELGLVTVPSVHLRRDSNLTELGERLRSAALSRVHENAHHPVTVSDNGATLTSTQYLGIDGVQAEIADQNELAMEVAKRRGYQVHPRIRDAKLT